MDFNDYFYGGYWEKQMNIMWLSDSPLTVTGYATITWNILNKLSDAGHTCYALGHNYVGQTIPPGLKLKDGTKMKFTIISGGPAPYAQNLIQPYIKKYKIDVFAVLLDTFMLYPWILNMDFSPAKTIFYFPSDGGGGMPLGCENILRKVNCPVSMSKYGQQQVKEMYNIDTKYIPHAIDIKNYKPLSAPEKENIRAKWGLNNKFVVGTVARNQGRKMMDRTLKAFKLFAQNKEDVVLFMHADPADMAAPFDMMQLINRYELNNKVVLSGMTFYNGFDYKEMNEVYNVMDIFLLTTSGEGFGVPIIEAQACSIPCVVTDYTTTEELVLEPKSGVGINLVGTTETQNPRVHTKQIIDGTLTGSWNVERGICSIEDCAKKLQYLYDNKNIAKELGENGLKNATENYNWDKVGNEWCDLMEELVK